MMDGSRVHILGRSNVCIKETFKMIIIHSYFLSFIYLTKRKCHCLFTSQKIDSNEYGFKNSLVVLLLVLSFDLFSFSFFNFFLSVSSIIMQ